MVEIHITDIIPYIGIPEPPNGRRNYNIPCPCCDNEPGEKHLNIMLKAVLCKTVAKLVYKLLVPSSANITKVGEHCAV